MEIVNSVLLIVAFVAGIAVPTASDNPDTAQSVPNKPQTVIGRVEYVVLQDVHIKLKARIDTGAGVSSLDAKIIETKQTADGERVVFQVKDDQGKIKTVERKIVEWAQIKVLGTNRKNRRPVVIMDFCLGDKKLEGRVNLSDRSGFLYPVIIGRNILKTGKFLIDPSQKFMKDPGCE